LTQHKTGGAHVLTLKNLVYARAGDKNLLLDLYLPEDSVVPLPAIVWVHGGAFRMGSKENPRALRLVDRGYAVASINYRLSQEAIYPAQIHDCKAAVRWLRTHAGEYGIDPDRIGAWGSSAGGHLVATLGTSGGVPELEGDLGNLAASSRVQAVCDFFGPSDFLRMNDVQGSMDHDAPDSPESQLVGAPIQERPDLVARANPITTISPDTPPFLIVHGDADDTVILNQSQFLYRALRVAGLDATFHIVEGARHDFADATDAQRAQIDALVDAFFDRHLQER
jgi:acetyl esterase/lipase